MRARIALFIKVCAAVEYAHANLVIHRDLKPANILVDDAGEPKLLDFGIARLIDAEDRGTRAVTATRAMTLAYASPEQVEGARLGTATDIYSLGVILYELLVGVRPFDHLMTDQARLNAIVSGDVPPMRKARNHRQAQARAHANARRIPLDVNAIVMKALRREPGQRYPRSPILSRICVRSWPRDRCWPGAARQDIACVGSSGATAGCSRYRASSSPLPSPSPGVPCSPSAKRNRRRKSRIASPSFWFRCSPHPI